MDRNVKTVVDYFLGQIQDGDDRPPSVVRALLAVKWPDREFICNPEVEAADELCCLDAFTDKKTGLPADDFYVSVSSLQLT